MDVTGVDVVVVGGGVQGLVILDTLIEAGYSCALVTDGELGAGQSLHSHGFLNTGFGMLGAELPAVAVEIVHPYLRARGVALRGNWVVLSPPGFPVPASLPEADLPAGFAPSLSATARKLPDLSFDKRQLVEALTRGREVRIIRGSVVGFRGREPVESVLVRLDGSSAEVVELGAKAVVVAAGCGSKRLLRDLVGPTPQVEMIKHRLVHMVCLRAPAGALPATSVFALSLGLMVAAHGDGERVIWYVTPIELGGPSYDDVPNDAAASPHADMLARAAASLLTLYPPLPSVEGLQVGHYAGYRQDVGDQQAVRLCAVVSGTGNVIVALPSGLVSPWLNAADTLGFLHGLVAPSGAQPTLPGRGEGVGVGSLVEDRPGFVWRPWEQWQQALPHVGVPSEQLGGTHP
jgi:glycine/D-amino acid oxidase-like deaminating enzyme